MKPLHMPLNAAFDPAMLARIEDAGINASAPRQQRWVDGWLVRLCPGKAKRARCIQAVAPGHLSVEEKLALCLPLYEAAGLHPFVRITPFSEPGGLDARLEALGMEKVDDTRVMVVGSLDRFSTAAAPGAAASTRFEDAGPIAFAEWVGHARRSSPGERQAHAERIAHAPVPHQPVLAVDRYGVPMAAGQVVIEGIFAGLYDVFTVEAQRSRGLAEQICRHLLFRAASAGARVGYLQVDAGNEAARRIYRRLGFVDAYAYHYRAPPGGKA